MSTICLILICLLLLLTASPTNAFVASQPPSLPDSSNQEEDTASEFEMLEIDRVSFYKLVSNYYNYTRNDSKVEPFEFAPLLYYTHAFFAWHNAFDPMSTAAVYRANNSIAGSNIVLRLPYLHKMYAPDFIESIMDFVIPCYESVVDGLDVPDDAVFISTLRAFPPYAPQLNDELLTITRGKFNIHSTNYTKSVHLLWETPEKIDLLEPLGYSRLVCGGGGDDDDESSVNLCDWTRLGIPSEEARHICLYRLIHEQSIGD